MPLPAPSPEPPRSETGVSGSGRRRSPNIGDAAELLEFYGWRESRSNGQRMYRHTVEAEEDAPGPALEPAERREPPAENRPRRPALVGQRGALDRERRESKRAYPVVVKRGRREFGAYAPEVPGSFVVERTPADARRRVAEAIATHLRLLGEMGDELPEPDPEVARALARVTDPDSRLPRDPNVEVVTVAVGPEDAPPDGPSIPPSDPTTPRGPRRETFVAILGKTAKNYSGEAPDLGACVATGDTMDEMRSKLARAISVHVQALVDDGDPLPEGRLTPEEALAQRSGGRGGDSAGRPAPDEEEIAELLTVEVLPPRPQALALNALWRRSCRNEFSFEADCTRPTPIAAGETWSGAYAADILYADDIWYGRIAEWQYAVETGESREELRRNLQAAVTRALLESVANDGRIPPPRRTAESALAQRLLRRAGRGNDEILDRDEAVEMIPVQITAPEAAVSRRGE